MAYKEDGNGNSFSSFSAEICPLGSTTGNLCPGFNVSCISEKNPETSGMSRATAMAKAKSIFSVLSASSGEFWVHMRVQSCLSRRLLKRAFCGSIPTCRDRIAFQNFTIEYEIGSSSGSFFGCHLQQCADLILKEIGQE